MGDGGRVERPVVATRDGRSLGETLPSPVYSPSPRPTFDVPTLITATTVTRHIWGDDEAREVADWIYASTDHIHVLVFGLAPGGVFRHSPEFRTVFAADEVLTVLRGRMILANPENGEVHLVERGESIAFGRDTWHHAHAHGAEELRVLELFAPPPSTGSSGRYARTRPYLETTRYADDSIIGSWPGAATGEATMRPIRRSDTHYRLAGDALIGVMFSSDQLTVANLSLSPGANSSKQQRGGDEIVYGLSGTTHVRAWFEGETYVLEVQPDEVCYLPAGSVHEYRNFGGDSATAIIGVAPSFLAGDGD